MYPAPVRDQDTQDQRSRTEDTQDPKSRADRGVQGFSRFPPSINRALLAIYTDARAYRPSASLLAFLAGRVDPEKKPIEGFLVIWIFF